MEENWFAVGMAIRVHMEQIDISQTQLIERSGLSKAIVGELTHAKVVRHRSPRTLAAMSEALGWHRDHLQSLLHGKQPPAAPKKAARTIVEADTLCEILTRLRNIERRFDELACLLAANSRDASSE
jgi:hypothetical protein